MAELRSIEELLSMPFEAMLADASELELQMIADYETQGDDAAGMLPLKVQMDRERALESPAYYATEIVDPYYKANFEPVHYELMDTMAAYILGETIKLDGVSYEPQDFVGFICEFSRDTFKSSSLRILLDWTFKYTKLKLGYDTRAMYVHQVLDKAIKAGEAIRNTSRMNKRARKTFPEFRGIQGEWDTKQEWRWPNFTSFQASEFSFTAYGMTSDKTGGHYTLRVVDDWETEKSVTNTTMLAQSVDYFKAMDPLRDRTRKFNPLLIAGTTYHHQGLYKTLEKEGGYLIWKVPAHKGSSKAIFDLCALDPRAPKDRKKIKDGIKRLEDERSADLNFPKRLPWSELYNSARSQGPRIYACQMQLNPTPEGDTRFDWEALDESWVEEIPKAWDMHLYVRCDPAISEKKDADECAILVAGVHWNASRYLIDGWMGREKQPNKIVLKAFDLAVKWQKRGYRVVNIGFEAVAYQQALVNMSKYGIGERAATRDGESVPMRTKPCPVKGIERPPDRTKHERIMSMDGPVTRREIKFWKRCPVAQKVLTQYKNFPYDRDDGLDAMHDFWIKTQTPNPPLENEIPYIPLEFQKMLHEDDFEGKPQLVGTNNTIPLAGGWN